MEIGELLDRVEKEFRAAGIAEARVESEILCQEELSLSRSGLYLDIHRKVALEAGPFRKKVASRAGRVPLAYVLGRTRFMGFNILVDGNVLIPRQETELLVEAVILQLSTVHCPLSTVIDIGTGSGNIAVSIAGLAPGAEVHAADISPEAIKVARKNAVLNGVEDRIRFYQGDLFSALENRGLENKAGIIVSNPPYIPSGDISGLQPEIQFEPRVALDGGKDGLDLYARIVPEAPRFLKPGGKLFLEAGFGQAESVMRVISETGCYCGSGIIKDYAGIERIIWAQKK